MKTRQSRRAKRPTQGTSGHTTSQLASSGVRGHDRSRHGESTSSKQGNTHTGSRAGRKETKPKEPQLTDDDIFLNQFGLKKDMVKGNNIYLKDINEFADIQLYANMLEGEPKPAESNKTYEGHIQNYLTPFSGLILPGAMKPYCLQYDKVPQNDKCSNNACSYNYDEGVLQQSTKLIHITPYQVYAICTTIMAQLLNNTDDLFTSIDWKPVSKAAQLPIEICQEFWWSFDITHIKDGSNGYFVSTEKKHYCKIDENYFQELERRVRCLSSICEDYKAGAFS